LSIGKDSVQELMRRAQDYVAANGTTSGGGRNSVRFLSATRFR